MRVSPPELAREFAGPQASSKVTVAPFLRSSSAVQPPNAPAPTTRTDFFRELSTGCEARTQVPVADVFDKMRREPVNLDRTLILGNKLARLHWPHNLAPTVQGQVPDVAGCCRGNPGLDRCVRLLAALDATEEILHVINCAVAITAGG